MGRGGWRKGAGRKPGSRTARPRLPPANAPVEMLREAMVQLAAEGDFLRAAQVARRAARRERLAPKADPHQTPSPAAQTSLFEVFDD